MSPREQQVLDVLEAHPRGLTLVEIGELIGGTHKAAGAAVYKLSKAGLIKRANGDHPRRGGRCVGIWHVAGWRGRWTPRPDVAAAWITREAV